MTDMWTCNVCNRTMDATSRAPHLDGRRHAMAVASARAIEWTCEVCKRTMDQTSKQSHLSGKAHIKKAKTYEFSAGSEGAQGKGSSTPGQAREPSPEESTDKRARAIGLNSQGVAAVANRDFSKAIELFTAAISLDAAVASFYTNRGIAQSRAKDYIAALSDLNFSTTLKKGNTKVLLHIARCRLFLGSPSSALIAVHDVLCLEPTNPNAHALKKQVLELQDHMDYYKEAVTHRRWRKAKMSYESCLAVYTQEDGDPPIEVQCWGIEVLIVASDWNAVLTATSTLQCNWPQAPEMMLIRALVLFLCAQFSEALAQLMALLKMDPDNQRATSLRSRVKSVQKFYNDAVILHQADRWDDAVAKWSDALQLVAEHEAEGCGGLARARLLYHRATATTKLEQFADSIQDLTQSLKLYPTYFEALWARGRIYTGLELFDCAVDDFTHALEHGATKMSVTEKQDLKAELKMAEQEREKGKDYYRILGISRSCTRAEIRKAYHAASLKHHPDKGGVVEKFKIITEAYSVLSDDTARQDYDSTKFGNPWSWNGEENDDDVEDYENDENVEEYDFYHWD